MWDEKELTSPRGSRVGEGTEGIAWAKALRGYWGARRVTCRARLEKQAQRPGPAARTCGEPDEKFTF